MDKELKIEAKRFKKVREEQNYTQQSFAELLDIGQSTVDIERGKTKIPGKKISSVEVFIKIASDNHNQN